MYPWTEVDSGPYPPGGQTVITDRQTSSDDLDFNVQATLPVTATDDTDEASIDIAGDDTYHDTETEDQTTEFDYLELDDGQGGGTVHTDEIDAGSKSFATSPDISSVDYE